MSKDDYGIYRKPTLGVVVTWLAVAAAIFFGAYSVKMKSRLAQAMREAKEANQELEEYKIAMYRQQADIQSLKVSLARNAANADLVPAGDVSLKPELGANSYSAAPVEVSAEKAQTVAVPKVFASDNRETATVAATQSAGSKQTKSVSGDNNVTENNLKPQVEESARLAGEILTYNPDTRRAYLSLGSANGGIQPGSRFTVWRGDKYVTDIRVLKVFSVTSTCEIQGPTPIGLRPGDIARIAKGI